MKEMRHLCGPVHDQPPVVADRRGRAVGLHRRDGHALVDVAAANDDIGIAEQVGVHRVGGRHRHVVAVDFEQHRRVELECLFGRHCGRQRLVVDDHHVGGVLGLHDRLGEHGHDRFADEAHAIDRQRRPSEVVVDRGHALERGETQTRRR